MNKNKIVIRVVLGLLGAIVLVWSLLPYFVYKILGLGNLTGIAVGFVLLVVAIIFNWLVKVISHGIVLKHGKIVKVIVSICLGVAILICLAVTVISGLMIHAAYKKPSEGATLVVLGCGVIGDRPSLMLEERIDAAAEYLKNNQTAVAVLSGGQGRGEDISEAECMRRSLVDKGIDEKRLYLEEKSTSTKENIQYSREIIEKNNLNSNVAIVTNEFHEYRASVIAKSQGLSTSAVSARTDVVLFFTFYVRELYGVVFEWIM